LNYSTLKELIELAENHDKKIFDIVQMVEAEQDFLSLEEVWDKMETSWRVMSHSIQKG